MAGETIEVTGKTVEEAILHGLVRMGKKREEVDVIVLSEGRPGILGIGAEDARVRLLVREVPAPRLEPPVESRPTRREPAAERVVPLAPVIEEKESAETAATPGRIAPGETLDAGEVGRIACTVVEELLAAMSVRARVSLRDADRLAGARLDPDHPIVVDISGSDLGFLIGRRGETLAALQYLVTQIVGKRTREWVRVTVDVERYRVQREESLQRLARRMADRVKMTGEPVTLEPMPANERRIIHLTLKDDPQVTTQSFGEGESRRTTILLKK